MPNFIKISKIKQNNSLVISTISSIIMLTNIPQALKAGVICVSVTLCISVRVHKRMTILVMQKRTQAFKQ